MTIKQLRNERDKLASDFGANMMKLDDTGIADTCYKTGFNDALVLIERERVALLIDLLKDVLDIDSIADSHPRGIKARIREILVKFTWSDK